MSEAKRTLIEYLDDPSAQGPGKGFGRHTIVFKGGPATIDGKKVTDIGLIEFRSALEKEAQLSDGRTVPLRQVMVHDVVIATSGLGAER